MRFRGLRSAVCVFEAPVSNRISLGILNITERFANSNNNKNPKKVHLVDTKTKCTLCIEWEHTCKRDSNEKKKGNEINHYFFAQ